jgi:hypothetical protein
MSASAGTVKTSGYRPSLRLEAGVAVAGLVLGVVIGLTLGTMPRGAAPVVAAVDRAAPNALQIVIRSEVAERSAAAWARLDPVQIVVRADLADGERSVSAALNPLATVIAGDVADRVAAGTGDH